MKLGKKLRDTVIAMASYQLYEDRRRVERVTMILIVLAVAGIALLPTI